MHILRTIFATAATALLTLVATPASAQDFMARQAPVDRKMKAVDTLVLRNIAEREMAATPASELYAGWDNQYAHRATALPETFVISLKDFCMPTPSRVVTSNFGARWGRQHKGLDIKVYIGDTIRAAFSGKVRIVNFERKGYGNYVVIRHPNGLETIYGHLSRHLVRENQDVRVGQPIGLGGNTGRSTGSHLHFETRLCGVALNPALLFDFRAQDVVGDTYVFRRDTYQSESAEATRLRGKIGDGGYSREEVTGMTFAEETAQREARKAAKRAEEPAPAAAPETARATTHRVKKGDTLYSLARQYGLTVEQLCKKNGISKCSKLHLGQVLKCS